MDKNEIIKVLEDWNFWKKELETGISRDYYLRKIKKFLATDHVVVISGARRSGKSFIMRQLARLLMEEGVAKNRLLMINFEDPRLPELKAKDLDEIFNIYLEFMEPGEKPYVFLDEIQEVSGWEKWLNSMQELKKAHLIVSGSNAKLLSKELATLLTGRHLDVTVFPLSFKEYLGFNNIIIKDKLDMVHQETSIKGQLRKYLEEGSYPEVVLSGRGKEILLSYFDDIINKDLIKRYKVRKGEKLKSLAKFYLNQVASPVTYNSSAKFLGLSVDTAEKFSVYLEDAYLLFLQKRFSFKAKEQEKSPRKAYVIDNGLANAIGFRFSSNWGRAAENIIFLELRRRQTENPDLEVYYWKDVHHREVDFVIKEKLHVKQLIQVSWDTNQPRVRERETRSLLKAMEEFNLFESLVITEDQEFEEKAKDKRIIFIPLWKWLLKGT